ncbi:class I SAM-dependent methyltransferase [Anaerobacillus sp. MEB173]|uniref:class I SAM-dependent methyltransferase n=1 Tax=Anaerobacillus sp. MEB173 TaxID=3383345 RepID=UPI003F911332
MGKSFAKWYDIVMSPLENGNFKPIRRNMLKKAYGSVLEVGSGTGINFPYYNSVDHVTAIEPSQPMIERSSKRIRESCVPIKVIKGRAEHIPFADQTFDTVVATLALCTILNPEAAIREMKRVCKREGKILLFEHVRMNHPFLAKLQDWVTPYWKKVSDGCCLNRKTVQLIEANGLQVVNQKTYYKGLFILMEVKKKDLEEDVI